MELNRWVLVNLRKHLRSVREVLHEGRSCCGFKDLSFRGWCLVGKSLQNTVHSVCDLCVGRWELTEMETSILMVLVITLKATVFPL